MTILMRKTYKSMEKIICCVGQKVAKVIVSLMFVMENLVVIITI